MDYCGPRGIPHSEFLSWSESDQDKALAWTVAQAERCPSCGTVSDEWLDENGRELDIPPFELISTFCVGCQILHDESKAAEDRTAFTHFHFRRVLPKR